MGIHKRHPCGLTSPTCLYALPLSLSLHAHGRWRRLITFSSPAAAMQPASSWRSSAHAHARPPPRSPSFWAPPPPPPLSVDCREHRGLAASLPPSPAFGAASARSFVRPARGMMIMMMMRDLLKEKERERCIVNMCMSGAGQLYQTWKSYFFGTRINLMFLACLTIVPK